MSLHVRGSGGYEHLAMLRWLGAHVDENRFVVIATHAPLGSVIYKSAIVN